ncbi:MAG: bifunctional enoyl-CoA hydratase/phosphate acetyltransferase [Bacteroidales bacterium]|nr:bifunctional enoyl-CoA hydratase/phosphate acetyltransferase [Bacteroidales bacterium]
MLENLSELREIVKKAPKKKLVVAAAHDEHSLGAIVSATKMKIVDAMLVGDKEKIYRIGDKLELNLSKIEIIDEPNLSESVAKAVKLVHFGDADILMKGDVGTAILLRGILNKEWGLRQNEILSHIAIFEVPAYHHKLIALTDVAMNIAPVLSDKVNILRNAIGFLHKLGIEEPKIAVLGAVELVNEMMPATLDAALLSKMADRGQIPNCLIDGPLAFDNAISVEAAEHKGIKSNVAGMADLLLLPDIEAGNVLYKSFIFFANAKVAANILGASAPVVLTSRSDSEESKLDSICLAAAVQ